MRTLLLTLSVAALTLLSACGNNPIGQSCTKTADCDSAQTCFPIGSDGFCSKSCSQAGTTTECPSASVCARQGATALLCSDACLEQTDCREGYACNGVSGTEVKACQLK